ncbi:hypothetical protein ILYODFUR_027251 [Ilyodon furcidens]|uniref:Uncharacterized protein n=1 Tax=Ilyodon furcidens TaxID=33524 RepID=A0ABV0VKL9_9TELE
MFFPSCLQLLQGCTTHVCLSLSPISQQDPSRSQTLISRHLSTPVIIPELAALLQSHPDRPFVNFLITGLSQGFFIGVPLLPPSSFICINLQSTLREPEIIAQLLEKEVSKGYMIGPFKTPPFSSFRISPLGIATKKIFQKKSTSSLIFQHLTQAPISALTLSFPSPLSPCIMLRLIMLFHLLKSWAAAPG